MWLSFGDDLFEYGWWNGEMLRGTQEKPIAFDLETELIKTVREPLPEEDPRTVPTDPRSIPRPSLGMAFSNGQLVLIHPSKLARFVYVHRSQPIVGHNIAFDWWVLHRHTDNATRELLWQWGDHNRLHDSMILDMLLQLGTGRYRYGSQTKSTEDFRLYPTGLGTLTEEWDVGELDKTDEYRLRFGELLGKSEAEIEAHPEARGFFSYALKDVIATYRVFAKQRETGLKLMVKAGWNPKATKNYEIRPDAVEKFGVLSESLQTKASIVLVELSRTPIRIDEEQRALAEKATRERYEASLTALLEREPELIKLYKVKKRKGERKLTKKSSLPQFDQKKLVAILEEEANRIGIKPIKSDGKLKGTSTSAKAWLPYAEQSPFIAAWAELEKEAKLLEFLTTLDTPEIYSNYNLLMVTGRTSAGAHKRRGETILPSINIQQMPREDPNHPERTVRSFFLPPEGMSWFSCDYGYIELRSLAAVCRAWLGWSKLGEAVEEHTKKGGMDPHQRTAAIVMGISEQEFLQLDKTTQKENRQKAKAVNFGMPGGLGSKTFVQYAKAGYGADFTIAEAKVAKQKWLTLYPEMRDYLGDRTQQGIEWQAGCKFPSMSWFRKKRLSDFLRAEDRSRRDFPEAEADSFWELLEAIAYAKGDEDTIEDVQRRKVTHRVRNLTNYRACTLTGRVRNNTIYTQACNTPFQSAAADGAKLAMWNLMRRGFKLIAFVHDAFDCAVDKRRAPQQCKQIETIMCESMQEVLGQNIPVAVEGSVAERWSKS